MEIKLESDETETSRIHLPHDKLFKKILFDPSAAKDILTLYLPSEVAAIMDLNQLTLQKDSFIDDEDRAYATDLLFKTSILGKENAYIWVLIEHQRNPDYWMPVRIFQYIAIIWTHLRKYSNSKKLPLVYPLVIYNGDRPYCHSLTLSDLIESQEAKLIFSTLFTRSFPLVDLACIDDETLRRQLQNHLKGVTLMMTLKHVYDRNIQTFFEQTLIKALKRLSQAGDIDGVGDILYYLMKEATYLEESCLKAVIHQEFSSEEDTIMTIAQKIEERGMQKGMQKGMEQSLEMFVFNSLKEGASLTFIERVTNLPFEKILLLQQRLRDEQR